MFLWRTYGQVARESPARQKHRDRARGTDRLMQVPESEVWSERILRRRIRCRAVRLSFTIARTPTVTATTRRRGGSSFSLPFRYRNSSTRSAQGSTPMLGGGSCVMRIGAEMWWHVSGGRVMARVQVGARARRPVARRRLKETTGNGNRDGRSRWRHEVQLGMPVTGHEQLALVLVRRRIGRRRLRGGRQPLEVELVRVPLAVYLRHDVLVVVVPASRPMCPSTGLVFCDERSSCADLALNIYKNSFRFRIIVINWKKM